MNQAARTPIPGHVEETATSVLDAAFVVHRALGPGLLESVYEACLCHELSKRQLALPVLYDGVRLDAGLRIDILVADEVIVELKTVERIIPLFEAPLLTYLRLTGKRLGLLINFNVEMLKDGITRRVL